ncbi:AAA family ATPase [Paracandidimonas lactea]|uniref:AAA family ATPase n=1 Tax=Paracandidimonas lactea TaxID=2895524 RepID=UPI001F345A44|nr:ATP-binding protein [Paracandidimonas lactea]
MKLTSISIDNLLGVTHIETALTTPVTLFAGANAAGKSSVREAVRAAFLGMPERVIRKKDLGQLVHAGEQAGSVAIEIEGGATTFTAPDGKQELRHGHTQAQWEPMALALPYCLEPASFAAASPDERRQLLFALTGASSKKEDIIAAMRERGLTDEIIDASTPMLRAGFAAAAKFAEERCRDAKASWKAATGETYGHVKAQSWKAISPDVDTTAIEQLKTRAEILKGKIGTEQTKLGAAEQKLKSWLAAEESREADGKAFAKLESLQAKLERDQDELLKWADQVKILEGQAGTGPRVGLVHDLAACLDDVYNQGNNSFDIPAALDSRILVALGQYETQHGSLDAQGNPEAAAKLPEARKARDLMQRSVDNDKRDIAAAQAAGARLEQSIERGSESEVESVRTILAGYQQELAQVSGELQALVANQQAAAQAQHRTATAAAAHQQALDWQSAIDALSPAGIPAQILESALEPMREALRYVSEALYWPHLTIDTDMMIAAGERPYGLLSESERWRADAIIALALASLSGLRMVALDRVDVLDLQGRADLIDGLDAMATDGQIDTALLFGTFKSAPNMSGFPQVKCQWLAGGAIAQSEAVKEAA